MDSQPNLSTCILALYGQYVLPRGGEIWLGTLVQAMAALGFGEAAVRSAALRLKNRGSLESRRLGRRQVYWLTELGLERLNRGGFRFSISPDNEWDGRWTVVVYTIPEERRKDRDTLRTLLAWWGFGLLAPGTWLSARPLPQEAEREWRELGVWPYLSIFRSEYLGPGDRSTVVDRAFPQLSALAKRYQNCMAASQTILHDLEAGRLDDERAFACRLRNLSAIVPVILEDPSLPACLLPPDWSRPRAESLGQEVQRALQAPAQRFFDSIYETPG